MMEYFISTIVVICICGWNAVSQEIYTEIGAGLDHVPYHRFTQDVRKIYLSNNSITELNDTDFQDYSSLSYLDLSDNEITMIGNLTFSGCPVRHLRLHRNLLTCMPEFYTISETIYYINIGYNLLSPDLCTDDIL